MAELEALEDWVGGLMAQMEPRGRRKLALATGRDLRRNNAKRIRANVEPDGDRMEKRKPREKVRSNSGKIRRSAKMFQKMAAARNLRIKASPDQVKIGYTNNLIARVAAVHHFGLRDFVGKTPDGKTIKTDYPARELLGISDADREGILTAALEHLEAGL